MRNLGGLTGARGGGIPLAKRPAPLGEPALPQVSEFLKSGRTLAQAPIGLSGGSDDLTWADVPTRALIPAFVISELKTAFLMGFKIYLPFLVIDMVVASILISMGMLMLPPVLVSLPFKILLFVLVDGWHLLAGSLLESFSFMG